MSETDERAQRALDVACDVLARVRTLHPDTHGWLLSVGLSDCVMIEVLRRAGIDCEIAFVDTGFHFPETMEYLELVERRLGRSITRLRTDDDRLVGPDRPEECCRRHKVEPLTAHLADRDVWVTGVRRADSATRTSAEPLWRDRRLGVLKVNPIVTWTDDDVAAFEEFADLPRHPLAAAGYRSIGCAPCTAVTPGDSPRSDRWPGTARTECGLHREFTTSSR